MTNIDIIQALDNIRINNLYVHNSELEGAKFSNEKLKDTKSVFGRNACCNQCTC